MKKLMLTVGALMALEATCGELTVAPGGMTVKAAVEKIRAARASGDAAPWKVNVRGFNALAEPVVFTSADHDVEFVGEDGATVSGESALVGWTDTGRGWFEAACPRGADGRPIYVDQLWVGDRRANRARLPNEGHLKVAAPRIVAVTNAAGEVSYREYAKPVGADAAAALSAIAAEDLPYVQLCVIHKWSFARRILRGYDAATGEVVTHSPSPWNRWQKWSEKETLFSFENVRSAFDAPGEWFQDMSAGKILYRPLPGETAANLKAVAPFAKASRLVDFRGDWRNGAFVRNITFRNIVFAHADSTPTSDAAVRAEHPDVKVATGSTGPSESWQHQAASACDGAITLTGVRGVRFLGCAVRHTGNYAFRFNAGCVSNEVVDCRLTDLGAGGIWMGDDAANVAKLGVRRKILNPSWPSATAFNLISNCTITCGGRYNPEGTAVALTHCSDTKVLHNDIHDFFYTGVSVGWTWGFAGSVAQRNEIGWNFIYDLGKSVMSDMGGVYTLGTSFGTRVHHNVIHDVFSYSYGGWALYCDEGSEGIVMENNLCWNTTDGGFHQHYGTGCVIRNNVFAFNRDLGAVRMQRAVVQDIPCTLHFVNNVVYVDHGPLAGRGVRNVGGVWANNLWYDARGLEAAEFDGGKWAAWEKSGKETGSVFADPKFRDPTAFDFTLAPDSPALKLGFKPLDLTGVGVGGH